MSRGLHVDTLAVIEDQKTQGAILVDLDFESGHVRVNSTDRDIAYGGNIFKGLGSLGAISPMTESAESKPQGITLELSGVNSESLSTVFNEHYQGRLGVIYLVFYDDSNQVIGDAVKLFQGLMDNQSVTVGQEGKIRISIENQLVSWQSPHLYLYNHADQQIFYPGDRGLEFVEQTAEKEISWGG